MRRGGLKTESHSVFKPAAPIFFWVALVWTVVAVNRAHAQIDPERRRLLQTGYNQPLEGRGPIAAYGFYYYNEPNFARTNLTLRAAIAPVYLDAELGFSHLLGPKTDFAIGLAGGGFAKSYPEIREGTYLREESFVGHGADLSVSVYHKFNPDQRVPLFGILRGTVDQSFYQKDNRTAANFVLPSDLTAFNVRTGLRLGGREPSMTAPLAMELSAWYEGRFRAESEAYGYNGDRRVEPNSHLFWGRALLDYTFDKSRQSFKVSLTLGTSANPDRLSAYRLGGVLPFSSEFPLSVPGYYFQELSARRFVLLNAQYSLPLDAKKRWNLTAFAASANLDYLPGLEQPGSWNSGLGGGITFKSPAGSWLVTLIYAYGINAIRTDERGANQIGILFQYDFEAKGKWFDPGVSPYRSRGMERLFRD